VVVAGSFTGPQEPLFAWQEVAFLGQPLGLVLARSQRAAVAGAAAVQVHYEQQQQQQDEDGCRTSAQGTAESKSDEGNGSPANGNGGAAAPGAGAALTTLAAAVAAGSWYDISKLPTKAARGAQRSGAWLSHSCSCASMRRVLQVL
jgi:CO/xanthine dehydrogenase Mo-binding subunit